MSSDSPFDAFDDNSNQNINDAYSSNSNNNSHQLKQQTSNSHLDDFNSNQDENHTSHPISPSNQQKSLSQHNSQNHHIDDDPFGAVDGGSSNAPATLNPEYNSYDSKSPIAAGGNNSVREETPFTQWEAERSQILAARATAAAAKKQKQQQDAKTEIEDFYKTLATKLQSRQKINRQDEKNFKADMKQVFETGTQWEKVVKLCNFQQQQSSASNTSQTSINKNKDDALSNNKLSEKMIKNERFKKLLQSLKNQKNK